MSIQETSRPSDSPSHRHELARQIGMITVISCGIGSMIGSGIFKKPGIMAAQLGSPELLVLVWIVTGFMTLFGSLSIAELSGMFADPGGSMPTSTARTTASPGICTAGRCSPSSRPVPSPPSRMCFPIPSATSSIFPGCRRNLNRSPSPYRSSGDHPAEIHGLKLCTIALILFLTLMNYLG